MHLKNGLLQSSVLIYTADIPETCSRKFIDADAITLAYQHKNIQQAENVLTIYLATLKEYFRTWKIIPNIYTNNYTMRAYYPNTI